jgi:hypothetical protein
LIQAAYDETDKVYEMGHLRGDQVRNHLKNAMTVVSPDAAQLMAGKQISRQTFKLKAFPTTKITEPAEKKNTEPVPVVVTNEAMGVLGETEDETPVFTQDDFIAMTPKEAIAKYGINLIDQMLKHLVIELKEGLNEAQRTAALQATFKKQAKEQKKNAKH